MKRRVTVSGDGEDSGSGMLEGASQTLVLADTGAAMSEEYEGIVQLAVGQMNPEVRRDVSWREI